MPLLRDNILLRWLWNLVNYLADYIYTATYRWIPNRGWGMWENLDVGQDT